MEKALRAILDDLRLGDDVEEKASRILEGVRGPLGDDAERLARAAAAIAVAAVLCGGTQTEEEVARAASVPTEALRRQLDLIATRGDIELLL